MKMSSLNIPGHSQGHQIGAFSITAAASQKPKLNVQGSRQKKEASQQQQQQVNSSSKRPQSSFTRLSIQNQGVILKNANLAAQNSIPNHIQSSDLQKNTTNTSHRDQNTLNLHNLQIPSSTNRRDGQIRLYSAKREQRETDCYQLGNSATSKKQKSNLDLQIELDGANGNKSGKQSNNMGSPGAKRRSEALNASKNASNMNLGAEIENSRFNTHQKFNKSNSSKLTTTQLPGKASIQKNYDWVGQILSQECSNSKLSKESQQVPGSAAERGGHDVYSNILVMRDPLQMASQLAHDKSFKRMNNYMEESRGSKNNSRVLSQRNVSSFDKVRKQHVLSIDSAKHSRDSKKRVVFIKNNDRINESHLNSTKHKNVGTTFNDFAQSNTENRTPVTNSFISMNQHQWKQSRSPAQVTLLQKTKVQNNSKNSVNGKSLKGYNEKFEIEMITTLPSSQGIVYNDAYKTQFRKAFQPTSVNRPKRDDQWQPKSKQSVNQMVGSGSFRSLNKDKQDIQTTPLLSSQERQQPQTTKSSLQRPKRLYSNKPKSGRSVVKIEKTGNKFNMQTASMTDGPSITVKHNVSTNQHENTTKASGKDLFELLGQSQQKGSNIQQINYEQLYGNSTNLKKQRPVSAYVNSKCVAKIRPQQIRSGHPARRNSRQFLNTGFQTPHAFGYCSTVGNALNMLEETQSRSINSTHALKKREKIIKETQCKLTNISNQLTNLKMEYVTPSRIGEKNASANNLLKGLNQIEKIMKTPPETWGAFTNPNLNYNPLGEVANKNQISGNHDLGLGVNFFVLEDMLSPPGTKSSKHQIINDSNKKHIHVLIEKKKRQLQARISRDLGDGSQKMNNHFMIATTSSASRHQINFAEPLREPTPLDKVGSLKPDDNAARSHELIEVAKEIKQSQESLNLQSSPSGRGDQPNHQNLKPTIFVKPTDLHDTTFEPQFGVADPSDYADTSEKLQGWHPASTGQSRPSPLKKLRSDQKRSSPVFRSTNPRTSTKTPTKRQVSCEMGASKSNNEKTIINNGSSDNTPDMKGVSPNTTMSRIGGQSPVRMNHLNNKLVIQIEGNKNVTAVASPELRDSQRKPVGLAQASDLQDSKMIQAEMMEYENKTTEECEVNNVPQQNEFLESILREQQHSAKQQKLILKNIQDDMLPQDTKNQQAHSQGLKRQETQKKAIQLHDLVGNQSNTAKDTNLDDIGVKTKKSTRKRVDSCSFDEDLMNQNINLADYPYEFNNLVPQPNLIDVVKIAQSQQQIANISRSLATFEPESFIGDKSTPYIDASTKKKQQLLETDLTPSSLKNLKKHEVSFIQKNHKLNHLLQSNNSSQRSLGASKKRKSSQKHFQRNNINYQSIKSHQNTQFDVYVSNSRNANAKGSQSIKKINGLVEQHKFTDVAKNEFERDSFEKNSQDASVKLWYDSMTQLFSEVRQVLGSDKTFSQADGQVSQEIRLGRAVEELEREVVHFLSKNRTAFSNDDQTLCNDIFAQLIVLKNNIRSYKDVAELMFMRRVEEIQVLVARRQTLITQVFNLIKSMRKQIKKDFAMQKPTIQMVELGGAADTEKPEHALSANTSNYMNMTNIQINTFGQYTPLNKEDSYMTFNNRMAYSTKSTQFLQKRMEGSTQAIAAQYSASSSRKFIPSQAVLHNRNNSKKYAKKLNQVLASRCDGLEKARLGRQLVSASSAATASANQRGLTTTHHPHRSEKQRSSLQRHGRRPRGAERANGPVGTSTQMVQTSVQQDK